MVGGVHLVLAAGRLGFLVNFLSHSVLVGFTAAAAIIIGFSQVKHLLGISIPRKDHFVDTVDEVASAVGDTNTATLLLGIAAVVTLLVMKRFAPRIPAALVVMVGSIAAVQLLDLQDEGVAVVGDIPGSLPAFGLPDISGSLIGNLGMTALVITLVGFMESIAVAKVYARRHRYDVDANQELVGLGMANVASGLFGGYPVTGGFSRTAVNDTAGARTPVASIITAGIVLATVVFFTPLFETLPQAALGAIIIVAVIGLFDVAQMRHIAAVKRSDLIGMGVAFFATLFLGIEIGILVAVVASMLVVFARISMPHTAVLGRVPGTTTYRNVARFPEVETTERISIIRIDAALSFVNATPVKQLLLGRARAMAEVGGAVVVDASGINDMDATGAETLAEVLDEYDDLGVPLHMTDIKGPVRDVMRRAGLWDRFGVRIHPSLEDAVVALDAGQDGPLDQRATGVDEREDPVPLDDRSS
jgi:SulP family sulfate permease